MCLTFQKKSNFRVSKKNEAKPLRRLMKDKIQIINQINQYVERKKYFSGLNIK